MADQAPAKHAGGRPSLYRPEYCAAVVEDGKLGFSLTAFAATLGVDRSTINEWADQHPEFSQAVKAHKAHRARKWEQRLDTIGENGAPGPGAATATIFALKNIAPEEWRDRVEHTGADGGPIETKSVDALEHARMIAFALAEAARRLVARPGDDAEVIEAEDASAHPGASWGDGDGNGE